ncbi:MULTISPECIES: NADH oxidase [unclassified Streptomyces]|uniref:NADH oxidase n=1 Tax=unclassified Streptomyces TaxID=2593676 RepID=UPI0035D902DC
MSTSTGTMERPVRPLHLWSLREDVAVDVAPGELTLTADGATVRLDRPDPIVVETVRRMELGPVLLANAHGPATGGPADEADVLSQVLPALRRCATLVVRTLGLDDLGGPLLSVTPVGDAALSAPMSPAEGRLRMALGLALVFRRSSVLLEADWANYRVEIHRPEVMWVVGLLAWPTTADALCAAVALPTEVTRGILAYLKAAEFVAAVPD